MDERSGYVRQRTIPYAGHEPDRFSGSGQPRVIYSSGEPVTVRPHSGADVIHYRKPNSERLRQPKAPGKRKGN